MPLINRIEVANFMNRRREEPWRPDWVYQEFDLKGENTAISIPNGGGKSTIVLFILAMLGHDKSLNDLRLRHFAPPSNGHHSHIRMETYIWADDDSPADLVAQSGGDFGGYPMVFGIYGNAGESSSYKLYSYRGTFEDCPIGRKEGNRVTLSANAAFLEKLSVMPARFPATQRDDTRVNWREYVAGIFDMPSIEQQLIYQKAKGAEGSSGYFDVNPPRGRPFSEAVFYERLAPELLTDMMSNVEEFSDERGIEDTIHQKVQGIIRAKARTAKTASELQQTRDVLAELHRINGKADSVAEATRDAQAKLADYSLQHAALKTLVVDDPLPGIPLTPPDNAPLLARAMVMQNDEWFLPDRAFELFTGEPPSRVNERATRHRITSASASISQLIDFACDIKTRDARGKPNQLYNKDASTALLAATTAFVAPYTSESAARTLSEAFDWVNAHADTNPARLERATKRRQRDELVAERGKLTTKRNDLISERSKLQAEQQTVGEQQAEYRRMSDSGLFSSEELADPAATGKQVETAFSTADTVLTNHRTKVAENQAVFAEWQSFTAQHGDQAVPSEFADMLTEAQETAGQTLSQNQEALTVARTNEATARTAKDRAEQTKTELANKADKIERLAPAVKLFHERFEDEDPEDLAKNVRDQLDRAEKRVATIETERSRMKDTLASLLSFQANHGHLVSPRDWLAARDAERTHLAGEMSKLKDSLADLRARRLDLDKAAVAPGKVAREVLESAGSDARPLHAAIEEMSLPPDRKERVLAMFSALLFSPVYAVPSRAAEVAGVLAEQGIEAPVFVASELADFCHNGTIAYDGTVARTWLVGVRTRPVDCLLDPTLVDREKAHLGGQIDDADTKLRETTAKWDELHPEKEEAVTARKAQEAIEKGFAEKDARLKGEYAEIEARLPRLRTRASVESFDAITAALEYRRVLGRLREDELFAALESATNAAKRANDHFNESSDTRERLESQRETLHRALVEATRSAQQVPTLRKIQTFMDTGGFAFMLTAGKEEGILARAKQTAEQRRMFRFDLAASFVRSGAVRPLEIEQRLKEIRHALDQLALAEEPLDRSINEIGEGFAALEKAIVEVDSVVRDLIRKYREMNGREASVVTVLPATLALHPLLEAASSVRRADAAADIAESIQAVRDPLADIDASALHSALEFSQRELKSTRTALAGEIDRVKSDSHLALNEQMRIGLEHAKTDTEELARMIEATTNNYDKSLAANEAASKHLDDEWANIGSWLENFTRRLPSNFETMRSTFRPERDGSTGDIVRAGFEIEARIADMQDVRLVLTSIVEKVEKSEKNRDAIGDDENLRARYDRSMRKDIREQFYRNVIIDPKIRVCIPSISRKPLLLEKGMVSSGQGVAMTLLWIVKMADYVTEREVRKQTVSHAARKKVRSMRTQFVIIDGAFSHLSDKRLIADALDGVRRTRGKFQLIITGHDHNYKNDYAYFPTYIQAKEIGRNLMYADSETRRLCAPEEIGSRNGVMETAAWHKLPEIPA